MAAHHLILKNYHEAAYALGERRAQLYGLHHDMHITKKTAEEASAKLHKRKAGKHKRK